MARTKLKERQRKLVEYYIESDNLTESAIKAGYSPKYAAMNARKTLQSPNVKAYYDELREELRHNQKNEKSIASITEVMEFYSSIIRGDMPDHTVNPVTGQEIEMATSNVVRIKAADSLMKQLTKMPSELQETYQKLVNERLKLEIDGLKNGKNSSDNKPQIVINVPYSKRVAE